MDCTLCHEDAGFNRAIVDTLSGLEVGRICLNCELEVFGYSLQRGFWSDGSSCSFCPRDGHFALPTWEPETEERDGDIYCSVAYEVTAETPRLCDECLHELRRPHPASSRSERSRRRNERR